MGLPKGSIRVYFVLHARYNETKNKKNHPCLGVNSEFCMNGSSRTDDYPSSTSFCPPSSGTKCARCSGRVAGDGGRDLGAIGHLGGVNERHELRSPKGTAGSVVGMTV